MPQLCRKTAHSAIPATLFHCPGLCQRLCRGPEIVSEEPLHLIPRELQAVLATDAREIEQFACRLDPRIVRADVRPKSRTRSETSVPATPKRKLEPKSIVG
jgi:hypothetical protein